MRWYGSRLVLATTFFVGGLFGIIMMMVTVGLFAIFRENSVQMLPFYSIVFDEGGVTLTMQWAYWLLFLVALLSVSFLAFLGSRSNRRGREHRIS